MGLEYNHCNIADCDYFFISHFLGELGSIWDGGRCMFKLVVELF